MLNPDNVRQLAPLSGTDKGLSNKDGCTCNSTDRSNAARGQNQFLISILRDISFGSVNAE